MRLSHYQKRNRSSRPEQLFLLIHVSSGTAVLEDSLIMVLTGLQCPSETRLTVCYLVDHTLLVVQPSPCLLSLRSY